MEKECEICGNFFQFLYDANQNGKEKNKYSEKLEKKLDIRDECFCEKCRIILKENEHIKSNIKIDIETSKGKISIRVKKKNQNIFINLHSKDYRYPLFSEECDSFEKVTVKFYQYKKMLEENEFKIIRNIESLDDKYRRIFSRVKFGILFND